ncbi:Nif3-like dinuclear metal center hexameric protein [Granulicella arctica]|uniref:Nif3-like dinuclear metal center hexameric protein n=1 Tax=Granulicella arctica TaxID=940613 RepID=UPI0021E0CE76|nr:Nif3-like dinuclear metal center hexameric protein [Granulicella arctica]
MSVSRRMFLAAGAVGTGWMLVPELLGSVVAAPVTVGVVIDRIKEHVGVPWRAQTVDNLLAGDPGIVVTGIATTMMATFEVCKRAQALGCNFIITHETPFYLHQDKTDDIKDNGVLLAKQKFLADHEMAILHFHDHLHAMHPDGVAKGMVEQLGWQANVDTGGDLKRLHFDGMRLQTLVQGIATKLGAKTIRVVGNRELPVHRVATSWGYCGREGGIALLADPQVEVLICGETREWELVEYAQDAITAGQAKALVVVGHVLSEQAGMEFATSWLKTFVTEVPVKFVPAPEPFWLG